MQLPQWSGVIAQAWPGSSFTTDSVLSWNCASRVSRRPSIPTADGPAGASGSAARRQLPDAAFAQEYPESDLKAIRRPGDRCSRPEDLARQPVERERAEPPGLVLLHAYTEPNHDLGYKAPSELTRDDK